MGEAYRSIMSPFDTKIVASFFLIFREISVHLLQIICVPCLERVKDHNGIKLESRRGIFSNTIFPFNVVSIIGVKYL